MSPRHFTERDEKSRHERKEKLSGSAGKIKVKSTVMQCIDGVKMVCEEIEKKREVDRASRFAHINEDPDRVASVLSELHRMVDDEYNDVNKDVHIKLCNIFLYGKCLERLRIVSRKALKGKENKASIDLICDAVRSQLGLSPHNGEPCMTPLELYLHAYKPALVRIATYLTAFVLLDSEAYLPSRDKTLKEILAESLRLTVQENKEHRDLIPIPFRPEVSVRCAVADLMTTDALVTCYAQVLTDMQESEKHKLTIDDNYRKNYLTFKGALNPYDPRVDSLLEKVNDKIPIKITKQSFVESCTKIAIQDLKNVNAPVAHAFRLSKGRTLAVRPRPPAAAPPQAPTVAAVVRHPNPPAAPQLKRREREFSPGEAMDCS
ncbi:ORF48 [Ranid herpesvirus 2]|uniref:ORF48 n=1 Tax=Ranid herpesvirus 2 TaxID=389214 RepID=Q14W58_9VIRU|nr:ORF48 [Ranid herpesvirus 2]ABG25622.1 ORF48 [Ranid herpesvirus 2]